MNFFKKIISYYILLAILTFNTALFFFSVNAILYIYYKILDQNKNLKEDTPIKKYGIKGFEKVYPQLTKQEIIALLQETWLRPLVYEPFTQFKEKPYKGKYVNVDQNGFRVTKKQCPWPPHKTHYNIFLFGGSTTFGYGVPDNNTIASYLQEALSAKLKNKVCIYNFGRAHYYSTQEIVLFQRLLMQGYVPNMAIFIDGLNDFYYATDAPMYTPALKDFVEGSGNVKKILFHKIPLTRFVLEIKKTFQLRGKQSEINDETSNNTKGKECDNFIISSVINRYMRNKQIAESIASGFGIQTVFVWQPIPTYNYDPTCHIFMGADILQHCARYGYPQMAAFVKTANTGSNFLWCADIQKDIYDPLYIDSCHYSALMSEIFANHIAALLINRKLIHEP